MSAPEALRVVLADAHAVVRDGLPLLLRDHGVAVVAAAASAQAAAIAVERLRPDLALVCPTLPDAPPGRPLARLVDGGERTRLALYVDDPADERLGLAVEHGALGVVAKAHPASAVAGFLRRVASGRLSVGAQGLVALAPAPPRTDGLTAGERRILGLLAAGHSTQAVAEALELSPHTVRTHVKNVLRKLGVASRAHAVAIAVRESALDG